MLKVPTESYTINQLQPPHNCSVFQPFSRLVKFYRETNTTELHFAVKAKYFCFVLTFKFGHLKALLQTEEPIIAESIKMSRRQTAPKPEELIQKLDDKVLSIKEEIESIIEELKNDVNVKSKEIEENKKTQAEGIAELQASLKNLKEEFKEDGKKNIHFRNSSKPLVYNSEG